MLQYLIYIEFDINQDEKCRKFSSMVIIIDDVVKKSAAAEWRRMEIDFINNSGYEAWQGLRIKHIIVIDNIDDEYCE